MYLSDLGDVDPLILMAEANSYLKTKEKEYRFVGENKLFKEWIKTHPSYWNQIQNVLKVTKTYINNIATSAVPVQAKGQAIQKINGLFILVDKVWNLFKEETGSTDATIDMNLKKYLPAIAVGSLAIAVVGGFALTR